MPKVTVTDNFSTETAHASQLNSSWESLAWSEIKDVTLEVMQNIDRRMPVDRGAARARWGSPGQAGGLWVEDQENLTIEHGAALDPYEYIQRLNEGSSTQAPVGFIDLEAEKATDGLADSVLDVIVRDWNGNSIRVGGGKYRFKPGERLSPFVNRPK